MGRVLSYGLLLLLLPGCSSWILKERCENTNWFDYSQKIAFQGKYLEEDGFVKDCKGVDRISAQQIDVGFKLGREKMCQYDEIYQRGREGIPVFFKFCDGLDMNRMKSKFDQGLKEFCTAKNGLVYGKSGKVYQKVCDAKSEESFLPTYRQGRKEYLTALINTLKTQTAELSRTLSTLSISEERISREYSLIPHIQDCSLKTVYNEITRQSELVNICEEASYIRYMRDRFEKQLSDTRGQMSLLQRQISKNIDETIVAQKELDALVL